MARRTKDEADRTKNALLDAAEKVFFRHGVASTSLEQVARAAGVTRGALYWHFQDKIALCEAMLKRVFLPQEDVLEHLALSETDKPLGDLKKACCDTLKLMATDKRRQRVVSILTFRCEYVEDMATIMHRRRQCKDRMLERCQRLFERARKLKQLDNAWTPALAAASLQALMSGLIINGLEGRKEFDLAKSGPACLELFFRSLAK